MFRFILILFIAYAHSAWPRFLENGSWCCVLRVVDCVLWSRCVQMLSKISQNRTNIRLKSIQNQWTSGLGASWDHFGSRVAPRTVPGKRRVTQNQHCERKCGRKCAFLEIPKIENGTKTARWRQDWHWDPLKTLPGSCFEQTWKINEILMGKWEVFDGLKPLKVWNCHRFHGF